MTAAGATSWHGFAQAIVDQAHRARMLASVPVIRAIASAEYPAAAVRPKNSRLCCDRLRERFGAALPDWKDALAACLADASLQVQVD